MKEISRALVRVAAIVAFACAALATVAPSASAAGEPVQIQDVGWWSNRPAALPRGAGKLEVALDPGGTESVAAIRFAVTGAVDHAILVLNEESGAVNATTSALRLCVAGDAWTAVDRGSLASAPSADCAKGQLEPHRDATFGRWTVDIAPVLATASASTVSVIIEPVAVKTFGIVDLGFVLPFSSAQLLVPATSAPPAVGSTSPPPTTPNTVAPPVRPTPTPVVVPTLPTLTTGAIATTPTTSATEEAALPVPGVVIGSSGSTSKPWGRLFWMVPLSALGGAGIVVARRRLAVRQPA